MRAQVTVFAVLAGCANPGPPKPPSLGIPAVVTDLQAERRGNTVDLRFTPPARTSDGQTLRAMQVTARLCRAVDKGPCQPLPAATMFTFSVPGTGSAPLVLHDALDRRLADGPPKLLTYRVELRTPAGKSAGFSNPSYTAAGLAPQAVQGLEAQGSRLGVVLRWQPADPQAEVLFTREDMNAKTQGNVSAGQATTKAKHGKLDFDIGRKEKTPPPVIMLNATGDAPAPSQGSAQALTLDTAALPDVPYRYSAARRRTVQLEGQTLEVWSESSPPVSFTLHDNFPPPPPTNLSIAGFQEPATPGKAATYAVDLIWEPVQDEQLAGYTVYRELLTTGAAAPSPETRGELLTKEPVKLPSFHDTTANGSKRYRYRVTAVDRKGNESDAVTGVLEPQVF